ncbi:hypothetical protein SESBI_02905 [Sesbania bispinosa]|nr:hypothetical protein SESBI_02905 [Sesbania bispinosa]
MGSIWKSFWGNTNVRTKERVVVGFKESGEVLDEISTIQWELPQATNTVLASTANELRQDRSIGHVNPEKLKAAAEGLAHGDGRSKLV